MRSCAAPPVPMRWAWPDFLGRAVRLVVFPTSSPPGMSVLPRICKPRGWHVHLAHLVGLTLASDVRCPVCLCLSPPAAGRPLKVRAAMLRLPAHGPGPGKGGASSAAVCAPAALSVHISIHAESVQVQNTPGATSPLNFECADLDASVYLHGVHTGLIAP